MSPRPIACWTTWSVILLHPRTSAPDRAAGSPPIDVCLGLLIALPVACLWAMVLGSASLEPADVLAALLHADGSREALIVGTVRLPRILAAAGAGAALAVSGCLMQAITANPLASPGLLGVNAGAAFAVVAAIVLFQPASANAYAWFAFLGGAAAGATVYGLGSVGTGGATPLKLTLAGVIISAFLGSVTTAILILDQATLDTVRFWTVGSLAGRQMDLVRPLIPYIGVGLVISILVGGHVTTLSLGSDLARAVGQNIVLWRLAAGGLVVILAGSAVAMAGPIGFVGLVVPHMARFVVGPDYRLVIPVSALGGALLVVCADGIFRHALPGSDFPVGITMAAIGAPVFIYLARRVRMS